MKKFLIGIDVGTSGCRSALFDLSGNMLACESEDYQTYRPHSTWAEQDPNDWWTAARESLTRLMRSGIVPPDAIAAIGAGGQTNGHVLIDADGKSLGKAIIWQDRRAVAEADEVKEKLAAIDMVRFLGTRLPIDATTIPARMLWLQRNEPEKVAKAVAMLQPKDFINFRLTGGLATDQASCKTIIDLKQNVFHDEYFRYLGLEQRLIPTALPPHGIMGHVSARAAKETGLTHGIPVVAGCIDAWCNILGSGAVSPGVSSDVAGSSEVITVFSNNGADTQQLNVIPSFDGYLLNGPTQSGGDSLKWFQENFPAPVQPETGENGYDVLNRLALESPVGAEGLVFIPYLQGERAPIWDSNARGIFLGITKKHRYQDFVRAIFEGVGFSVRHVLETAEKIGSLNVSEIRISGSGAKSVLWNQLKADITGKLVRIPKVLDTGCLGAALIAGVGVGCYQNYASAGQSAVQVETEYQPNSNLQRRYQALFNVYKEVYPSLKPVFDNLVIASEVSLETSSRQ